MILKRVVSTILLLASLGSAALTAQALQPQLGEPVRDPSITVGPGGTYYLTATTSAATEGLPPFAENRGVKVWKSTDLNQWDAVGFVFDLWDPRQYDAQHHGIWLGELTPLPGLKPGDRARALTAPRVYFFEDRFWITHSRNGYGVGLLRSKSDRIDGEYDNFRMLEETSASPTGENDGTLFKDRDGTLYLVWGGGLIAPLTTDLDSLLKNYQRSGTRQGTEGSAVYLPTRIMGFPQSPSLPAHGAPYGALVVDDGERYHYIYSATTFRDGGRHEDAFIASADQLLGEYSTPRLFIPDAGRISVFKAADKLAAVYASSHPNADNYQEPVIVSLERTNGGLATAQPVAPVTQVASLPTQPPASAASNAGPVAPPEMPDDLEILAESIAPLFDEPLRDTAILKASDGNWYLTGTSPNVRKDGTLDWANNRGVRLWKSADRDNWQDLGFVWEIERDARDSGPAGAWQLNRNLDLTTGAYPTVGRGITAPEIHQIKGTFWISYSMNGMGTGLLKSTSGKPEGPYEDLGRITRNGRDASLFENNDGTVYWVWDAGLAAPMKDDMSGINPQGEVAALFAHTEWYPRYMRRPELMGQWGSQLIRDGDWYIWLFTSRTGRNGINTIEPYASWSKSLEGPWGEPSLAIANGGQTTATKDENGHWWVSVSGEDEYAQAPFRPAMTRLGTGKISTEPRNASSDPVFAPEFDLRPYNGKNAGTQFSAVESEDVTFLDLWNGYPDYLGFVLRDVYMEQIEDGSYYMTGSLTQKPGGVDLYKSEDKLKWEPVGRVYDMMRTAELDEFDPEAFARRWDRGGRQSKRLGRPVTLADVPAMEMKAHKVNGTWYMTGNTGNRMLLRSTTDSIEGPYEPIRFVPGCCDVYEDRQGRDLHLLPNQIMPLEDFEQSPFRDADSTIDITVPNNLQWSEDVEVGMVQFDDTYIHYTCDWTGSYDQVYAWNDILSSTGWSRPRIGAAYGGNGYIFQENDGSWWFSGFYNNNEYAKNAALWCRMFIYPLFVGWENDELIIEPLAVRANRAKIERMGVLWQRPR